MKNSNGFTLIELVVTIMLVGILLGTAIPTFHRVVAETQSQVNISNMEIIKDPIAFVKIMHEVSKILPKTLDDEDIASIMLYLLASYIPDEEIAEDVMRYATASVREFYKKLDLEVNDGLSTTKSYTYH